MQSWSQHFTETTRQDCMSFGNIESLTENFTCLDRVQLENQLIAV